MMILNVQEHINTDLNLLSELSSSHNLKLNPAKSFLMLFGSKKHTEFLKENFVLKINDVNLPIVNSTKNLGIILDSELRFKDHVKKAIQKSFSSLKLIFSNRHMLSTSLKKMLCDSLVLSNFNYCDFIYGYCLDSADKNRIQKIQNSCARLIYGIRKYDHISYIYKEHNWLKMDKRRTLHLGTMTMKLVRDQSSPIVLREKLQPRTNIHNCNLRNINKLTMPLHRTALFQRSFTFNAVKLYNSLPDDLLNIENIKQFKFKFKNYLLSIQS